LAVVIVELVAIALYARFASLARLSDGVGLSAGLPGSYKQKRPDQKPTTR